MSFINTPEVNQSRPDNLHRSPLEGAPLVLPTRIITFAWGDPYIDMLLSLTLPALLAPGNLPYVAAVAPCEFVVITEQSSFEKVLGHPTIRKLREICALRLIGMDDLVAAPDKYGLSLTHALHRGFADLGPAMTESWQIFFNADFIVADGSLRSLMRELRHGKRLVASPSYCTVAGPVLQVLRDRIDRESAILSIPPREMAALILENLHATIRGKVIDNQEFHMALMDQFYSRVDEHTLIGHQMPIAIVGMRPERYVAEPNSLWDHGLMREYCPDEEPTILGDSDDFLMLELRNAEVFKDQVLSGPLDIRAAADRMILWVTPYQRSFALYPLTLHSRDLPPDLSSARDKLRAFVDSVLSLSPRFLPSHVGHLQWNYHLREFVKTRHQYIARKGERPEHPLASWSTEIDDAWWSLQRAKERLAKAVELRDRQLKSIRDERERLSADIEDRFDAIDKAFLLDISLTKPRGIYQNCRVDLDPQDAHCIAADRAQLRALDSELLRVPRQHGPVIGALEAECERLETAYDQLLPKRLTSAVTPLVKLHGPAKRGVPISGMAAVTIAKRAYHRIFGRLPRVSRLNPYWPAFRQLIRIVDDAVMCGARRAIFVGDASRITHFVGECLPEPATVVSVSDVRTGNLLLGFEQRPEFDLCICDLAAGELAEFPELCKLVQPVLSPKATTVGFYLNADGKPLPIHHIVSGAGLVHGPMRTYYAGSALAARALKRFNETMRNAMLRPGWIVRAGVMFCWVAPSVLLASWAETRKSAQDMATAPHGCVSVTIEFVRSGEGIPG